MKWFKHMTASWDDEDLAKLVGKGGMEGLARYGLFWRMVEIVADQLDPKGTDPTVCYSITRWSLLLSLRGSLVFSTLSTMGVTRGVSVTRDGDDIRVTIPNLLKYRDEYSKKSRHTQDNVGAKNRADGDTEGDTKKKQVSSQIPRSVPPEELAGTLPLCDSSLFEVSKSQISEWSQAFPGVEVRQELRKFKVWCDANPERRKTRRGIKAAVFRWLSKAQDDTGKANGKGSYGPREAKSEAAMRNLREALTGRGTPDAGTHGDGDPAGRSAGAGLFEDDGQPVIEGTIT